ncbi:MAG TPA: hypothetical protein ENH00_13685 [Actinobacteria bacterium]|nr:hypothetical protein [Actinomycetota bacterium]
MDDVGEPEWLREGVVSLRFSGHQSWELRVGIPEDLNFALGIRASLGLSVSGVSQLAAGLLEDGLAVTEFGLDLTGAAREWPEWWNQMTGLAAGRSGLSVLGRFDPPAFDSLEQFAALRPACQAVWPGFSRWWNRPSDRKRRLFDTLSALGPVPNQLVSDHEHRIGREARPFVFQIDVLAVESADAVVVDDVYAQVGCRLVSDLPVFTSWFRAILRRIG